MKSFIDWASKEKKELPLFEPPAIEAIFQRDYPVIQGFILTFSTVVVLVSLVMDTVYALVAGVVFATRFTFPVGEGGRAPAESVETKDLWVARVDVELDSTILYDSASETLVVTDGATVLRCADGTVLRRRARRADHAVEIRGRGVLLKRDVDEPGWERFDPERALPGEPVEREFILAPASERGGCPHDHTTHRCRNESE